VTFTVPKMQARSGIARSDAFRSNYASANPHVTIDGTDRTTAVAIDSLDVVLGFNAQPSSATFTLLPNPGFTPAVNQIVYVGVGSADNYVFGGQIVKLTYRQVKGVDDPWIDVECTDFGRLLDRRLVGRRYTSGTVTDAARHIVQTFTSGFYDFAIEEGLADVDDISFTNETVRDCMLRLARLAGGGGLFSDPYRRIHLFGVAGDAHATAGTNPDDLTSSLATLREFSYSVDATQQRTRTIVECGRTSLLADIPKIPTVDTNVGYGLMPFEGSGFTLVYAPVADAQPLVGLTTSDEVRVGAEVRDALEQAGVAWPAFPAPRDPSDPTAIVASDEALVSPPTDYSIAVTSPTTWVYDADQTVSRPRLTNIAQFGEHIVLSGAFGLSGSSIVTMSAYSSGWLSLKNPLYSGDTIKMIDVVLVRTAEEASYKGEEVVARVSTQDGESALAAIEGGDGVHEYVISDGRLSVASAREVANADNEVFQSPLEMIEWETIDLNALPGRQQDVNMSSFSGTLIISQVEIVWPAEDYAHASTLALAVAMARPRRRCMAGTQTSSAIDAVALATSSV
jgi:hypothetical protein